MKNPDSHIYLYAKHWYKESDDRWEDLQKIFNHRNGEYKRTREDMLQMMLPLVWNAIQISGNPPHFFNELIYNILAHNPWQRKPTDSVKDRTLRAFLNVLRFTKCRKNGIELDPPDSTVLPFVQEGVPEDWKRVTSGGQDNE